ncbi:hypothetical protein C8R43DRAFT_1020472, partial [Mycena crocata]
MAVGGRRTGMVPDNNEGAKTSMWVRQGPRSKKANTSARSSGRVDNLTVRLLRMGKVRFPTVRRVHASGEPSMVRVRSVSGDTSWMDSSGPDWTGCALSISAKLRNGKRGPVHAKRVQPVIVSSSRRPKDTSVTRNAASIVNRNHLQRAQIFVRSQGRAESVHHTIICLGKQADVENCGKPLRQIRNFWIRMEAPVAHRQSM